MFFQNNPMSSSQVLTKSGKSNPDDRHAAMQLTARRLHHSLNSPQPLQFWGSAGTPLAPQIWHAVAWHNMQPLVFNTTTTTEERQTSWNIMVLKEVLTYLPILKLLGLASFAAASLRSQPAPPPTVGNCQAAVAVTCSMSQPFLNQMLADLLEPKQSGLNHQHMCIHTFIETPPTRTTSQIPCTISQWLQGQQPHATPDQRSELKHRASTTALCASRGTVQYATLLLLHNNL
jgi:hypothetical protein